MVQWLPVLRSFSTKEHKGGKLMFGLLTGDFVVGQNLAVTQHQGLPTPCSLTP
jgi:hypothetical protein